MKKFLFLILLIFYSSAALFLLALFYSSQSLAETNKSIDNYFYIGKMDSHNKEFMNRNRFSGPYCTGIVGPVSAHLTKREL